MIQVIDIVRLLSTARLDLSTEKQTQAEIWQIFRASFLPSEVSREHRLGPGDIPDFLIAGSIVVEVKAARAPKPSILRQLARYARHPEVEAIVLVSATALGVPARLEDKPVTVVSLGRAWL